MEDVSTGEFRPPSLETPRPTQGASVCRVAAMGLKRLGRYRVGVPLNHAGGNAEREAQFVEFLAAGVRRTHAHSAIGMNTSSNTFGLTTSWSFCGVKSDTCRKLAPTELEGLVRVSVRCTSPG